MAASILRVSLSLSKVNYDYGGNGESEELERKNQKIFKSKVAFLTKSILQKLEIKWSRRLQIFQKSVKALDHFKILMICMTMLRFFSCHYGFLLKYNLDIHWFYKVELLRN